MLPPDGGDCKLTLLEGDAENDMILRQILHCFAFVMAFVIVSAELDRYHDGLHRFSGGALPLEWRNV